MRALVTSIGSRDDIQPFAALARALQRAGHEVTLHAPCNVAPFAAALGLPFAPMAFDADAWGRAGQGAVGRPLQVIRRLHHAIVEQTGAQFRELPVAARGHGAASAVPHAVAARSCRRQSIGVVPHGALFPRCAVVVHHGGAGTTAAAARAGVPQVVVPHLGDQHYWAERLRALGVAPAPLSRARLDGARLAAALASCARSDVRARAAALGAQLAGSDATAAAVGHLEGLVMRRPSARSAAA